MKIPSAISRNTIVHHHEDREVQEGFCVARLLRGGIEARTHRYISLKTSEIPGMLRGDFYAEQIQKERLTPAFPD